MTYPSVIPERQTMDLVLAGRSLARFGDGEFNLCAGHAAKRQKPDARLQRRLVDLLAHPGDCLIGIPNLASPTPKAAFWSEQASRMLPFLKDRTYASAFISRPDSAPWIDTPDYWADVEALWRGQDVTVVRGGRHGLSKADLIGARTVHEVMAPERDAWSDYDELLELIGTPARVLLCLGPTATVLAADLCAKGVHAIDIGHVGLFLRKHRSGEPMVRTDADKAFA